MYDGISPLRLPAGADLYAGYDDGRWPDAAAIAARFPNATVLRITTNPADEMGDVLDVERGDATPADTPGWLTRRRLAGAWPSVYCSLDTWGQVKQALAKADVAVPPWWIAHYLPAQPVLPADWAAWQWNSTPGYDQSVVADYWPGVDPAPGTDGGPDMAATETVVLADGKRSITAKSPAGHLLVFTEGADDKVAGGWSVADVTDAVAAAYPGTDYTVA